jgi:outer membrane protein assembly factor BamA
MELPFAKIHKRYLGYNIGIRCENIDFKENPSKGIQFYYKYWKGLKMLKSSNPWGMHEFSMSKYFSLPSSYLRQQVIAINVWGKSVDSWNKYTEKDERGIPIYHRPSPFAGANLGGRYKFRSYPEARFNNASSLLYSCEYRIIPNWNPLKDWGLLKKFNINIDWIQFVAFIETGRVAPNWNIKTLHSDMHYDYGLGVRFFANEMVIRVDGGFSNEGSQIQMYIGQSF